IDKPIPVHAGVEISALKGIAAQTKHARKPQFRQWLCPELHCIGTLLFKHQLPVFVAERHDAAVIADVEEGFSWALLYLAREIRQHVDAVDTDLERFVPNFVAVEEL